MRLINFPNIKKSFYLIYSFGLRMFLILLGRRVQPYVLDLGSANGTYVNNSRIEAQKYVQLLEKVKYHYIHLFQPILLYQSKTYLFDSVILCIFLSA